MCRFVFYQGEPVTISSLFVEPAHSLIKQSVSAHEREEPLNGDGFGVAWYAPEHSREPAAFRSISPAWNNRNLLELSRVTASGCILAHVRAATQSLDVSEANCHPFTAGPYAFMHNGDVGGFDAIRREAMGMMGDRAFRAVRGRTDSEHLFGLMLDRLSWDGDETADELADVMVEAAERMMELGKRAGTLDHSYLNMVLSNGHAAAVCRFTTDVPDGADSLYVHTGRRYVCEAGVCRMIAPEKGKGSVIVSSERLSADEGWQPVGLNTVVVVEGRERVRMRKWGG
jgi:predicted glutamine amidotransferase